jgi:hypothetical protein
MVVMCRRYFISSFELLGRAIQILTPKSEISINSRRFHFQPLKNDFDQIEKEAACRFVSVWIKYAICDFLSPELDSMVDTLISAVGIDKYHTDELLSESLDQFPSFQFIEEKEYSLSTSDPKQNTSLSREMNENEFSPKIRNMSPDHTLLKFSVNAASLQPLFSPKPYRQHQHNRNIQSTLEFKRTPPLSPFHTPPLSDLSPPRLPPPFQWCVPRKAQLAPQMGKGKVSHFIRLRRLLGWAIEWGYPRQAKDYVMERIPFFNPCDSLEKIQKVGKTIMNVKFIEPIAAHLLVWSHQIQRVISPLDLATFPLSAKENISQSAYKFVSQFLNDLSKWVEIHILSHVELKDRVASLNFFLLLLEKLKLKKCYSCCLGILLGVQSKQIER